MGTDTYNRSAKRISHRLAYAFTICMCGYFLLVSFVCISSAHADDTAASRTSPSHANSSSARFTTPATHDARPAAEYLKTQIGTVLAGEEYQRQMQEIQPDLRARIMAAIVDFIGRVLAPIFEARDALNETSPIIYWSIVSILTITLILLLYHIFITISGAFREPAKKRALMGVELPPRRAAADLRKTAAEAAGNGDFAQAVVYMYLAALVHLDQREIITFTDADTNRQILLQLRGEPELAHSLEPLSLKAEAITYGHHPATHTDFEDAGRIVGEVLAR